MGINKKDDLELDFNGLRTENYSSTIPYMKNLTADAKTLINRLPVNEVQIGLFQDSENYDMYRMFEENPGNVHENNFSETSPFISSDVYNNLVRNQRGGGASSTSSSTITSSITASDNALSRGGGHNKEDKISSSESTTSSSGSSDRKSSDRKSSDRKSTDKSHHKKNKHKHNKSSDKSSDKSSERSEDLEEELTEKMLSHSSRTTATDTNSFISSSVNQKYQSDSEVLSTISLNHKGRHNYTESINTSDINIVSVDD